MIAYLLDRNLCGIGSTRVAKGIIVSVLHIRSPTEAGVKWGITF